MNPMGPYSQLPERNPAHLMRFSAFAGLRPLVERNVVGVPFAFVDSVFVPDWLFKPLPLNVNTWVTGDLLCGDEARFVACLLAYGAYMLLAQKEDPAVCLRRFSGRPLSEGTPINLCYLAPSRAVQEEVGIYLQLYLKLGVFSTYSFTILDRGSDVRFQSVPIRISISTQGEYWDGSNILLGILDDRTPVIAQEGVNHSPMVRMMLNSVSHFRENARLVHIYHGESPKEEFLQTIHAARAGLRHRNGVIEWPPIQEKS